MSMVEKKFKSPCPPPTPYEREVLTILIEECAEVQQRATKMLRFGRDEVQPGQRLSNAERLSLELGDLGAMIDMARDAGLIDTNIMSNQMFAKFEKLKTFMQHDPDEALKQGDGDA